MRVEKILGLSECQKSHGEQSGGEPGRSGWTAVTIEIWKAPQNPLIDLYILNLARASLIDRPDPLYCAARYSKYVPGAPSTSAGDGLPAFALVLLKQLPIPAWLKRGCAYIESHVDGLTASLSQPDPPSEALDSAAEQDQPSDGWKQELQQAIEEGDNVEAVEKLLENEGALETRFKHQFPPDNYFEEGVTPLMLAAGLGREKIVDLLLDRGANVFAETIQETCCPYFAAAQEDRLAIVQKLLDREVDISYRNVNGHNAVHVAAYGDSMEVMKFLLEKEPGLCEVKDNIGRTPLVLAAEYSQRAVEMLLDEPNFANIEARADNGETALSAAVRSPNVEMVECLLNRGALWSLTESKRTILHLAAYAGQEKITQLLLERLSQEPYEQQRKTFAAQDEWGDTALGDAAAQGHLLIILDFLRTKVYLPTSVDTDEIHFSNESEVYFVEREIMASLRNRVPKDPVEDTSPSPDAEPTKDAHDWGPFAIPENVHAVLFWATLNGRSGIIELCVEHLPGPVELKVENATWAHAAALGGHTSIMQQILAHDTREVRKLETDNNGMSSLHLAAKHKHIDLVRFLIDWLSKMDVTEQSNNEFGPAIPAPQEPQAMAPTTMMIDTIVDAILQVTNHGDTPISLAATGSTGTHRDIEAFLWKTLTDCINKKPDSKFFELPLKPEARRALELAAQFEQPREETYLEQFLRKVESCPTNDWFGKSTKDYNVLKLAVYLELPTVVWWLLSNGGYRSENDLKMGKDILKLSPSSPKEMKSAKDIIHVLLTDPPPISERRPRRDDHHQPTFQFRREMFQTPAGKQELNSYPEGTVLDLYHDEHQVTFHFKHRLLSDLIYETGPNKIMSHSQFRDFSSLKKQLEELCLVQTESQPPDTAPKADEDGHEKLKDSPENSNKKVKKGRDEQKLPDLRWVHLPVNNELMIRLSIEKDLTNKEHRPLARFVQKSWTELFAGGEKFYMKPQCLRDEPSAEPGDQTYTGNKVRKVTTETDQQGKGNEPSAPNQNQESGVEERVALYMPYIFWRKWTENKNGNSDAEPLPTPNVQDGRRRRIVHGFMTLDQYGYASLKKTDDRDSDQALWKYIERLEKEEKQRTQGTLRRRSTQNKHTPIKPALGFGLLSQKKEALVTTTPVEHLSERPSQASQPTVESIKEPISRQILIVNQLWLWIVDGKTIITSTTREPAEVENSFFQRVLTALQMQEKNSSVSTQYMLDLILNTAIGLFNKRDIKVVNTRKSPLDVYRESIQNVRNLESNRFKEFMRSLDNNSPTQDENVVASTSFEESKKIRTLAGNVRGQLGKIKQWFKRQKPKSQSIPDNPYGNIAPEAELLQETKDICDELGMLKSLVEDQQVVWQQAASPESNTHALLAYEKPADIKAEIEEMIIEAESVKKSIDTLLDLKQKQANIIEAKSARQQSEETAKQSDTIMVFTVVTILFVSAFTMSQISVSRRTIIDPGLFDYSSRPPS
ncbi:ankyrin [Penicillium macrosclerotiorum]|uniref:ankyrin n=1 Tax=Penicillium macrosclerotiorum TaxID=303699 RepID=UPI002547A80F|nr:ankyrin [Penicillium macrosclerotiorum]KAJ5679666.1 ankyrin [Penicillium macrosclerotiorum]